MKVKLTIISSTILIILLFGACSSLPLPGSPTESLFVITGEVTRDLGMDRNGNGHTTNSVTIKIVNQETGKQKSLVFSPRHDYTSIPLEPGRYAFDPKAILSISYKKGRGESQIREEYFNAAPFLIEPSTVFISPVIIKLSPRNGWYSFSTYKSFSTSNTIRKKAVAQVVSEKRFKAWELYQMIGWELEEE
ncbi:hypothetical protein [Oceanispirochaeta sp.]|jgi:hypothetical protein|uniref:hypothetical protein n=1 Tax=Oceanispirochaeta sp. TaxID=2035350 RepID=UPI002617C9C6|nr:hypothetical protein [Oceanispirochaeta sp.]MDA3956063.1 hypothetical protein [Oceanispirochaeta sp.]